MQPRKANPVYVIELKIERRAGYIYVTSEDVPGLHLWGDDASKICKKIIPAIKMLFRLNRNQDVDVVPAARADQFPDEAPMCGDDRVAERYVMYPSVAA